MRVPLELISGLGRVAFGAGLMAAPGPVGSLLVGGEAREPAVRVGLRTYGTRDVVLGVGTLSAVAGRGDVAPWLLAGIASDVLDAAIQLGEWSHIPADKRLPGVLSALGAAGAGVALLARR